MAFAEARCGNERQWVVDGWVGARGDYAASDILMAHTWGMTAHVESDGRSASHWKDMEQKGPQYRRVKHGTLPMTNRVVFITGASSGIGRAAALAFARAGYAVCGLARREERLEALQDEIANLPGQRRDFLPVVGDVRRAEDVEAAVARTLARFGRLDVLVANAGVGQHGAVADADWAHLETVLRTNIDGVLHSVRACVPAMRAGGGGQILIVSSVVAGIHTPYTASYAASKAFVSSLAGSLRLELEGDGIGVTDVLVGRTETEFNHHRMGSSQGARGRLPTASAERVARALVKAAERKQRRVIMGAFDRALLAGGVLAPGLMARLAKRQYEPVD